MGRSVQWRRRAEVCFAWPLKEEMHHPLIQKGGAAEKWTSRGATKETAGDGVDWTKKSWERLFAARMGSWEQMQSDSPAGAMVRWDVDEEDWWYWVGLVCL